MPVTLPANFVYRNFWQLQSNGPSTNNGDCGPAAMLTCLDLASMGNYDVGLRPYPGDAATRSARIVKARQLGGMPVGRTTGTSVAQNITAFLSTYYANQFALVNRQPPGCRKLQPGDFDSDLIPDIQAGKCAMVAVNYAPIDGYQNHLISGQWGFASGHMVAIANYHLVGGTPFLTLMDPIADHRLEGTHRVAGPGPQDVPVSVMRTACGLYTNEGGGTGKVSGMTFYPRALLDPNAQLVTAISLANPTHVTTQAAHGRTTGDYVTLTGTNSTPPLTGPYLATVLDATHFTVPVNVTVAGTSGTWAEADAPPVGGSETPFSPCSLPGPG